MLNFVANVTNGSLSFFYEFGDETGWALDYFVSELTDEAKAPYRVTYRFDGNGLNGAEEAMAQTQAWRLLNKNEVFNNMQALEEKFKFYDSFVAALKSLQPKKRYIFCNLVNPYTIINSVKRALELATRTTVYTPHLMFSKIHNKLVGKKARSDDYHLLKILRVINPNWKSYAIDGQFVYYDSLNIDKRMLSDLAHYNDYKKFHDLFGHNDVIEVIGRAISKQRNEVFFETLLDFVCEFEKWGMYKYEGEYLFYELPALSDRII